MEDKLRALREADQDITSKLKGPMDNMQRALLVEDRKDIREAIKKLEEVNGKA